jgi:hypothetical protein
VTEPCNPLIPADVHESLAGEPVDDGAVGVMVSAVEHPALDDWVRGQAAEEAARSGLVLGPYIGRETALTKDRPPDMCCHIFFAWRKEVTDVVLDSGAVPGHPAG